MDTARDFLLYIAIGLLVAAFAASYGLYWARKGVEPNFKNDWSVTIATAALVQSVAFIDERSCAIKDKAGSQQQ